MLSFFKLPSISALEFDFIPDSYEYLNNFLIFSLWHKFENLHFDPMYKIWSVYCIDGLKEVALKCTRLICLLEIDFSLLEFWTFVKAAKGTKQIEFNYCTIPSDTEWDFGEMSNWKIEKYIYI